jgi:hypothetical protein
MNNELNIKKEIITQEEYNNLPKKAKEDYVPCGGCTNYFLAGEGVVVEEFNQYSMNPPFVCKGCASHSEAIPTNTVKPTHTYEVGDEDGTNGREVWVFPVGTNKIQALRGLLRLGISLEGFDTGVDFSPSGRKFAYPIGFKRVKTALLAYQSYGIDV